MIIERIVEEIKKRGISRYQVSKDTGIDNAVLCRIFHGTAGCNLKTADKLCRYLELDLVSIRRKS
jgi:ribosome-binding protein aMBF1 (putative translation factor)